MDTAQGERRSSRRLRILSLVILFVVTVVGPVAFTLWATFRETKRVAESLVGAITSGTQMLQELDLSFPETATRMGRSLAATRKLYARALARFSELLQAYDGGSR